LRISLAVISPLRYDKLAVEVVELDDIARVFCRTLRVGERPRLGSRGLTISRLAGIREITDRE
jgi:hypothetical protein